MLRAAVYSILMKDGNILIIRRHNTAYRDGEFTLPAGHVEPQETFMDACIRETEEEVCVVMRRQDLELIHVMQRYEMGVNVVDYYFITKLWQGEPRIGEPDKADALKWVSLAQARYDSSIVHYVRKALDRISKSELYSWDGIDSTAE